MTVHGLTRNSFLIRSSFFTWIRLHRWIPPDRRLIPRFYLESRRWCWHANPSTEDPERSTSLRNGVSLLKGTCPDVKTPLLGVVNLPSVIPCLIKEQDLPILVHMKTRTHHLLALSAQTRKQRGSTS